MIKKLSAKSTKSARKKVSKEIGNYKCFYLNDTQKQIIDKYTTASKHSHIAKLFQEIGLDVNSEVAKSVVHNIFDEPYGLNAGTYNIMEHYFLKNKIPARYEISFNAVVSGLCKDRLIFRFGHDYDDKDRGIICINHIFRGLLESYDDSKRLEMIQTK